MTQETLPEAAVASDLPALLQADLEAAEAFARDQHASATRRAYRSDFRVFRDWCAARLLSHFPAEPETISAFIAAEARAGIKASTIGRRLAAIRYAHVLAGYDSPTGSEIVRATLKGIRRMLGVAPSQKPPATARIVALMVEGCADDLRGLRDRALLLLGFSGAFRRSELAGLRVDDLEEVEGGPRVYLRRSKTDQEGAGQVVAIVPGERLCPVAAVQKWLDAEGIVEIPMFRPFSRSGRRLDRPLMPKSVALIVKAYAERAGLDPAQFAGYSLRAGFLIRAAANGAPLFKMIDVSGHKSADTFNAEIYKVADEAQAAPDVCVSDPLAK